MGEQFMSNLGPKLVELGYPVIPVAEGKKYPTIKDWQKVEANQEQVTKWLANGQARAGVGILAARCPGLDIDVQDAELVEEIVAIAEEVVGQKIYIRRVGKAPKVLIPFRLADGEPPFTKVQTPVFESPDGNKHKVEGLASGQQWVAYHLHPDTQAPYDWPDLLDLSAVPWAQLIPITHAQMKEIVRRAMELMKARGWTMVGKGTWGNTAEAGEADPLKYAVPPAEITPERLQKVLDAQDADDHDNWVRVGMALWHQFNGSAEGLDQWEAWSQRSNKWEAGACAARWPSFKPDYTRPLVTVRSLISEYNEQQEEKAKENWEKDPIPLPDELLPVKPFSYNLLPDALRPWVADVVSRMQCPPDFVAASLLAVLAVLVGRCIAIRPQMLTDWTVIANLWVLLVGRPGVMKSPAQEASLSQLKPLVARAIERYETELCFSEQCRQVAKLKARAGEKAAGKKLEKDAKADVSELLTVETAPEPVLQRYYTTDATPEALGELLRQNPNGLLVHRDEMVSLIRSFDREDRAEARGLYLTGWNGDSSYIFDRIGRGMNLHIPAVCLSLLGGTQPARLAEYIRHAVKGGAADDGLIQRFGLLVWPDNSGEWKNVDRQPDEDAKKLASRVFDNLAELDPTLVGAMQDLDNYGQPTGVPYLRFDDEAHALFLEWRTDLEHRLSGGELHPALESHLAKYRKTVPAIALLLHLADDGRGPVSMKATERALAWAEYLESHARRAYGSITHGATTTAKEILRRIRSGDLAASFSSKDVWRPCWSKLSDREQVGAGLEMLVDYGWLIEHRDNNTGGRPAITYHAHPAVMKN